MTFGIPAYQPNWLAGREPVHSDHARRLRSLAGRELTSCLLVWDGIDDEWFADGPVLFDFEGERVELNHQKTDELSITWNSIDPRAPIDWESERFALHWRESPWPELAALTGRRLVNAELLEADYGPRDLASGTLAVCFRFAEGAVTVYNAFDENGMLFGTPGPEYRLA